MFNSYDMHGMHIDQYMTQKLSPCFWMHIYRRKSRGSQLFNHWPDQAVKPENIRVSTKRTEWTVKWATYMVPSRGQSRAYHCPLSNVSNLVFETSQHHSFLYVPAFCPVAGVCSLLHAYLAKICTE
jgi:hypothetical protein